MTDSPEITGSPENIEPPAAARAKPQPPAPLQPGSTAVPGEIAVQHAAPTQPPLAGPAPTASLPAAPLIVDQQPTAAPLAAPPESGPPVPPVSTAPSEPAESGSAFRRTSPVVAVALLAVGALVGGVSGAGVSMWAVSANQSTSAAPAVTPANVTINDAENATVITAVALNASDSVVTISAATETGGGTGSGVVLSDDGYVLTNTHVVTLDGASGTAQISVQANNGRLYTAQVVGTDPISDLAVIKLDGAEDLKPITFADSSNLNVGDTAIAIGAPLGLAGTVTNGIVSALNRSITIASSAVPEETTEEAPVPEDSTSPFDFWQFDVPGQEESQATASSATISIPVIQTDAAINPGNSGGALLDSAGELIGINVAIATASGSESASGSIGVGFAIPSNLAERVANEIIENGEATHGLLGASISDVTAATAVSEASTVGARVEEITAGGAAEQAGIEVGDVITGFNGLPITGATDLTAQVRALAAGADADATIVRDGKTITVDVTLGAL